MEGVVMKARQVRCIGIDAGWRHKAAAARRGMGPSGLSVALEGGMRMGSHHNRRTEAEEAEVVVLEAVAAVVGRSMPRVVVRRPPRTWAMSLAMRIVIAPMAAEEAAQALLVAAVRWAAAAAAAAVLLAVVVLAARLTSSSAYGRRAS